MAKPQIGKTKWAKALKRGFGAAKHQLQPISQIRAAIAQLLVENEGNQEASAYLLQMMAHLDIIAEQNAECQEVLLELWSIGTGTSLEDSSDE